MGENAESYLDKVRQPVHICWIVDTAHSDGHAGHRLVTSGSVMVTTWSPFASSKWS